MSNAALIDDKKPWGLSHLTPWVVCLSAGLFFLYEFFQLNVFDVINSSLKADFNLDTTALGWLSSAYLWANILFLLPAGFILDSTSVRRVILIALFVCVFGTLGFALSYNYPLAFFCHFLTGIGNAFCFLACVVLVSRWFEPKQQGFILGFIVTMAFIGGMLAHTPFAHLAIKWGWRSAVLFDGAVGCLIWIWLWMVLQDEPEGRRRVAAEHSKVSFKAILNNRQTWLAGLYTSCLNLPILVLCVLWGVNYLTAVHGLTLLAASNTVSLILIGSIVGCPLAGFISDRVGRRKPVMLFGALMSLLIVSVLSSGFALSLSSLSFLFFALGLFSGTQVVGYPVVAESNLQQNTGSATAVASVVIMGGGALAQVLFGWLMQIHAEGHVTAYQAHDFEWAMWLFPIMMGVACSAVLGMKETYCKRL